MRQRRDAPRRLKIGTGSLSTLGRGRGVRVAHPHYASIFEGGAGVRVAYATVLPVSANHFNVFERHNNRRHQPAFVS
jgi:hypothetical protein